MTIYTPNSGPTKEDGEGPPPEVVTEPLVCNHMNEKKEKDALTGGTAAPSLITITARRRRSNCANICVLFTALFVLATGIIGGIYLYRHLAHRSFQGWCGVRYYEYDEQQGVYGKRRYEGHFEQHIELDKEYGRYEKIEVPDFDECKRAVIVHDFEKNLTAIVDQSKGHCFIKQLDRSSVRPPQDFWDLLKKIETGYYLPDAQIIHQRYKVMQPEIENLQPYGYFIWRQCRQYASFELELIPPTEPIAMAKRAAGICLKELDNFSEGDGGMNIVSKLQLYSACD